MKYVKIKLVVSLIIFAFALLLVTKLEVKSNMEDMLPEDSITLKATQDYNRYFKGQEQAYIVISEVGELQDLAIDYMKDLSGLLEEAPFVESTFYEIDKTSVLPYGWAYVDRQLYDEIDSVLETMSTQTPEQGTESVTSVMRMIEEVSEDMSDSSEIEYVVNEAGTHYMMVVRPVLDQQDFEATRMTFYNGMVKVLDELKAKEIYQDLDVGLSGGAFIQDIEADTIAFSGLGGTMVMTLGLILVVVIVFFGSFKQPLLSIYPLLLGAVMAAAAAYIIYGSLNMFSVSFALLLLGLGIDFAVHLIARYNEERRRLLEQSVAIKKALGSTGKSIIIGAFTTAFAFTTFGMAKFKAFEQMGIISAIGILSLCIAMLVLIPAMIILFDRGPYKVRKYQLSFKWLEQLIAGHMKRPYIGITIIMIGIIAILGNVATTEVEGDLSAIYPEEIPSLVYAREIEEAFDLSTNTLSIYLEDMEQLREVLPKLEARGDVQKVESILEYMPEQQVEKLKSVKKLFNLLEGGGLNLVESGVRLPEGFDELILETMTYEALPESVRNQYVGKEGKLRVEIIPSVDIYEEEVCATLAEGIYQITGKYPVGMPMIMNEVTALVKSDMVTISLLCLGVIFVLGLVAFRRFSYSLLMIVPIILTVYFTLGLSPLLGINLNLFSVAAFPLIIGIGIDSAIHLLHRLRSEKDEPIAKGVGETGQAILLTTLTTMIGFASLANINHPGMISFGLIVVLGMGLNIILTMAIVPLGVKLIRPRISSYDNPQVMTQPPS